MFLGFICIQSQLMCFSYSVNLSAQSLQSKLGINELPVPQPGFFFSGFNHPHLPVILAENGEMLPTVMQWGLIPPWAKNTEKANELAKFGLNARSETLEEKPMFKGSWQHQPCVIPASGFFEWKEVGGKKQPYYIHSAAEDFLLFAGIWSSWVQPESGAEIQTYAIITTEANDLMAEIHNVKKRMPAILDVNQVSDFLLASPENRLNILQPCANEKITAYRVSNLASNARANRNVNSVLQPFSEGYSQTLF